MEYPKRRSKIKHQGQANISNCKVKEINYPLHAGEKDTEHLHDMLNGEKRHIAHHQEDGTILIYGQI